MELQISQEVLADRSGLHRTYISDVERGARNLSLESIGRLAAALEISVSSLFDRAGGGDAGSRSLEILLIEDDPDDEELTRLAFRKAGLVNPLHVVRDGPEALDFLSATGRHANRADEPLPGVILLDLKLPTIDGLEVLRRIKSDDRLRDIPIIVLTASKHDHDMEACRQLGARTYITKPVDFFSFSEIAPRLHFGWSLVKPS